MYVYIYICVYTFVVSKTPTSYLNFCQNEEISNVIKGEFNEKEKKKEICGFIVKN